MSPCWTFHFRKFLRESPGLFTIPAGVFHKLGSPVGVLPGVSTGDTIKGRITCFYCVYYMFYFGGNGAGSNYSQINGCFGIFIDKNSSIYVSDNGNNRVMKFLSNSSSGILLAGGNGAGNASNQFNLPMGIYVDSSAAIYVADTENHRIQKWTQGSSSGTTVAGGNEMGSNLNQLSFPRNVICDTDGTLYISDTNNHRIMKWTIGASNGSVIAGISGTSGTSKIMLNYPNGIAFDSDRNLYVADSSNHRVQKFLSCTSA
ncbi:unnamed protein product [Didymodactylos carnosus]|uniref:NHL repeat-containing protein n=1 Tax=Didymodactylos carnosus TaxID=1234261 RepID=A0A8S2V9K5_9BILA|nr:unnamed protein product [Didymodactylos carnosus]CAF4373006.1 unnamed protein product [Didymodactylos carnosus]